MRQDWTAEKRDDSEVAGYPILVRTPGCDHGISRECAERLHSTLGAALRSLPPAPSSCPSVKVRIAVCVDETGSHRVNTDRTAAVESHADHFGPTNRRTHVVWVEADVPLPPEAPTVQGQVSS